MRDSIKSTGQSTDSVIMSSGFVGDSTQDNQSSFFGKSDEEGGSYYSDKMLENEESIDFCENEEVSDNDPESIYDLPDQPAREAKSKQQQQSPAIIVYPDLIVKQPESFLTGVQSGIDLAQKKIIMISNFDKKVGFAKEIKRISDPRSKLPSISVLPSSSRMLNEEVILPSPLNPSFRSVFHSKKNLKYSTNSLASEAIMSAHSISQEHYLFTEQRLGQLKDEQKERFLPIVPEEHSISQKDSFFWEYKNSLKIMQYEKRYKSNKFQYHQINSKSDELCLLPKTFNMFRQTCDVSKELNLGNYGIGNSYFQVFAEALKADQLSHLRKLKLSGNNFKGSSLSRLFKACTSKLKVLDASHNPIRGEFLGTFKPLFARTALAVLNLSDCRIGDPGFSELFSSVKENKHLRVLNLSSNNLTDLSAAKIKRVILYNSSLFEIYLHWNNIKSEGGAEVLSALIENSYLKVVDLSYNSLKHSGELTPKAAAYQLKQILAKDSSDLLHLDVSYNNFSAEECQIINEGLRQNNWLYGFHFEGNSDFIIDQRGFMAELKGGFRPRMNHGRNIKSIKPILNSSSDYSLEESCQDICWICQGWQEICIKTEDIKTEPLFLHLSHLNFHPILMQKNDNGEFEKHIMAPPSTQISFFFSNPLNSSKGIVSQTYQILKKVFSQNFNYQFDKNTQRDMYLFIRQLNVYTSGDKTLFEASSNEYKVKITYAVPREQFLTYQIPVSDWNVANSIWKDYRAYSEENYKKCLDFDLNNSKIAKFVKDADDLGALRLSILEKYSIFNEIYKIQASIAPQGDLFCIGVQTFLRLMQKTKLLEGGKIKFSDIDRLFITTNFNPNDSTADNNPLKSLVRYEFIEILVRLAHEKYPTVSYTEALAIFYENDIKEHFLSQGDSNEWRLNKFWNKEIEEEIVNEMKLIKDIFDSLCAKNPVCFQSSVKCVDLQNFIEFMGQKLAPVVSLPQTNLEQQLRMIFHLSLQCHIDDLNTEVHKQMGLIEFIETIARAANLMDNQTDEEIPLREQFQKILYLLCDEEEKQQILMRKQRRQSILLENQQKEIKIILLKTRKEYNFKPYIPSFQLKKYANIKLLSHQPRFIPSLLHGSYDAAEFDPSKIPISCFDMKSRVF